MAESNLKKQDLSTLVSFYINLLCTVLVIREKIYSSIKTYFEFYISQDVTKLTPLSPEVISRQATINIGRLCLYNKFQQYRLYLIM